MKPETKSRRDRDRAIWLEAVKLIREIGGG